MERYVLDTNTLLKIIRRNGEYYIAWNAFHKRKYIICVSTEILMEYEEILKLHVPAQIADNIINQIILSRNTQRVEPHFKMQLIASDDDDNKFVDCAIAANAKYIVSDDKHFNVLKKISFPVVVVRKLKDFIADLKAIG